MQRPRLYLLLSVILGVFGFVAIWFNFRSKIKKEYLLEEELKNYNLELRAAYEDLEQFSYRCSHDLKAPLTTIKGFAEYIRTDIDAGNLPEARKNATRVLKNAETLERLVTDLLNLAKADLKEDVVEEIDVGSLIEQIKAHYADLIASNNVTVDYTIVFSGAFFSERVRIQQVLENLVVNAIKYSDPDEHSSFVLVSGYSDDQYHYSPDQTGRRSMKQYSVLIIDDNEGDRYLLKRKLTEAKLTTHIFEESDGQTALEFLRDYSHNKQQYQQHYPPMFIFLDINMPLMNGFQFLEEFALLRGQQRDYVTMVVMMFTSSEREEDQEKAMSYDFV